MNKRIDKQTIQGNIPPTEYQVINKSSRNLNSHETYILKRGLTFVHDKSEDNISNLLAERRAA